MRSLAEASEEHWLGKTLGSYRLVSVLGRGGMGTVFRAERDDAQYEQTVAIKVVALAAVGEFAERRLQSERRILAGLEHPNIARLLDAGTAAEGVPYFVMEYVDGKPITEYCREAKLSVDERVRLAVRVCHAVRHAHRNLVVHRDIKPSNILVTAQGEPKLLDFGIAKLLDGDDGSTRAAMTMTMALTPGYAGPEQIAGKGITTATDVYSLGVLLYELLSGQLPHAWESRVPSEIERALSREPTLPSTVWSRRIQQDAAGANGAAESFGQGAGAIQRRLGGDLDNIVLRALRYDPEQRYGSAGDLADDLERYLEGRPVQARPATWSYLARKFVRLHAPAVTAAAAIVGTLAIFSLLTYLQSRDLERERDAARLAQGRAEAVTEFLLESYRRVDPQHNRGETVTAREVLDDAARRIENELAGEPELQASMMHTLGKVHLSLGLYESAESLIAGARDIRGEVFGTEDELYLETVHQWGRLQYQRGDFEQGLETVDSLLAVARPDAEVGSDLQLRAQLEMAFGKFDEAVETSRLALERTRNSVGELDKTHIGSQAILGQALQALRRYDEAEEELRRALELQGQLVPGDSPVAASILSRLAALDRQQGDLDGAEKEAREALAMRERLFGEDHPVIALDLGSLADILMLKGDLEQAAAAYDKSQTLQRRLWGADHPRLAMLLHNQAFMFHRRMKQPEKAEPLVREAISIWDRAYGENSRIHPNMGFFLVALGEVLTDSGRPREAEKVLREALDLRVAIGQGASRNGATTRSALANALMGQGRLREAEALLLDAHPVLEAAIGNKHRITRRALGRLTELYTRLDRPDRVAHYQGLLEES